MFKNLFDLSLKRTPLQAIIFYIVYYLIGVFLSGLLSGLLAVLFIHPFPQTYEEGYKIGAAFGVIISLLYGVFISLWIIISKRIYNSFLAVLLVILSVPLLGMFGLLLGFIPVAILTTYDNKNVSTKNVCSDEQHEGE